MQHLAPTMSCYCFKVVPVLSIYINGASRFINLPRDTDVHRFTVAMDQSATGDPLRFFVDGELVATRSYNGPALADGGTLVLGQEQDSVGGRFHNAQAYRGHIYSVNLWNSALTTSQIEAGPTGGNVLSTSFDAISSTQVTTSGTVGPLIRGEVAYTSSYSSIINDLESTLEDQPTLPIDLHAALCDADGSETLQTTIENIPVGVMISDGTNSFTASAGSTSVDVSTWNLNTVFATPIAHDDTDIVLHVVSTSTETATGEVSNEVTTDVTLVVRAVADAPTLSLTNISGPEDTSIALSGAISGALIDTDGSETLSYELTNIPANVQLTLFGAPVTVTAGSVTLSAADIANLALVPAPDFIGTLAITVTAIATEQATGDQVETATARSAPGLVNITITPVADIVNDTATTNEDVPISINVLGNDNFEATPSVTSVSAPSNGVAVINADGTVTYSPNDNFSGNDSFTYTVTTANNTETATVNITVAAVNDPPTITAPLPDAAHFDNDLINLDVSGGFSDIDGGALTFTQTGLPAGLTMSSAGVITGTIDGSASQGGTTQNGSYFVQVTADDGNGGTVISSFTFEVSNRPPVVDTPAPDRTDQETDSISLDASSFFTDSDGDTPEYSATGLPAGLSIDPATGEITGTISGTASSGSPYNITLTLNDGEGGITSTSFEWTINNLDPTIANPMPDQVNQDGNAVSIDITDVFAVAPADTLTFSFTGTLPPGLSLDANTGLISGVIDNSASQGGAAGVYTIQLEATDTGGGVATDSFTWSVGNPSPAIAAPIPNQSDVDGQNISLAVAANFIDPDGDTLIYTATGLPAGLSIDSNTGLITGTLANNASTPGSYNVRILADDLEGGTSFIDFVWVVQNPAPIPVNDGTIFVPEDTNAPSIDILANDGDPDGDTFSTTTATALNGTVSINGDGSLNYTPNLNYVGPDTLTYTVTDADGAIGTAQVVIEVTPVNDDPTVSTPIADQSHQDGNVISLDITGSFADIENDTLSFVASGLPNGLSISSTGVISGTIDNSASQGGAGGVYNITVTANDGNGGTTTDTFTWTIVNPRPMAVGETFVTDEDTPVSGNVLGNDSDVDGDDLAINTVPLTLPANGTVVLQADGSFVYVPNLNFNGSDSFEYQLDDGEGGTASAIVNITINDVNDPPVVNGPIPAQSNFDADVVSLVIAGNFSDVDNTTLQYSATNLPDGLQINATTGEIFGTLTSGSSQGAIGGVYQTVITATDSDGASESLLVPWTVQNIAPIATADSFTTIEQVSVSGNVLVNDSDPDGDILTINTSPVSGPTHGTVILNADGSFTYTPRENFNGTDSFVYQLSDGNGGFTNATVTIVIQPFFNPVIMPAADLPTAPEFTPIRLGDQSFKIDGIIIETAEGIGDLNSISNGIGIDQIIRDTANTIGGLEGMQALDGVGRIIGQTVDNIDMKASLFDRARNIFDYDFSNYQAESYQLISLQADVTLQLNGSDGSEFRLVIDGLISGSSTLLELYIVSPNNSLQIVEIDVVSMNGTELASPVRDDDNGMILIERVAGRENLEMRINVRFKRWQRFDRGIGT